MKVKDLLDSGKFQVIHAGEDPEREITTPFCCDLLSVAMGKAPAGCVWASREQLQNEYTLPGAFKAYKKKLGL